MSLVHPQRPLARLTRSGAPSFQLARKGLRDLTELLGHGTRGIADPVYDPLQLLARRAQMNRPGFAGGYLV